jgi:hypothetical protein
MNAFTFGDQAFLARAGSDYDLLYPLRIGNLPFWVEASDYSAFANNHAIQPTEKWPNRGNTGGLCTPSATAPIFHTPTYSTGQPSVFINGTSQQFAMPFTYSYNILTTVIVHKNMGGTSVLLCPSGTNTHYPSRLAGPARIYYQRSVAAGDNLAPWATPTCALNVAQSNVMMKTGAAVECWTNSTSYGSGAVNNNTVAINIIGSGAGSDVNNVDFGCVMIFDIALSSVQYLALYNNYLKPRFGLP